MDHHRFDQIARAVSHNLSRRSLAGLAGIGALGVAGVADAGKKNKKKKKKVKFNNLGCVDVGKFCKTADQCCSGICDGKKGKEKCQAHDESTCQNGQQQGLCGGTDVACQTASGQEGICNTTTGKAGYCSGDGVCSPCKKDADCISRCGTGAACVPCNDCDATGGFGCLGPESDTCSDVM